MKNELQLIQRNKLVSRTASSIKERTWEVAYGIKTFYLTDKEKDFLVSKLQEGAKLVVLRDMVLSDKVLYIIPNDEAIKPQELPDGYFWGPNGKPRKKVS